MMQNGGRVVAIGPIFVVVLNFEVCQLFSRNLGVNLSATHLFIFGGFHCTGYLAPKIASGQLLFTLTPPGLLINGCVYYHRKWMDFRVSFLIWKLARSVVFFRQVIT